MGEANIAVMYVMYAAGKQHTGGGSGIDCTCSQQIFKCCADLQCRNLHVNGNLSTNLCIQGQVCARIGLNKLLWHCSSN